MAKFLDLPVELIRDIFEFVGWELNAYNRRERQGDLCSFALVHPYFLLPAQQLLYKETLIRNAGRATLLSRTLSSHTDLASLVQAVDASSSPDRGPPWPLLAILRLVTPRAIALSRNLFMHEEGSPELQQHLRERRGVVKFSYGFGPGMSTFQVHEILQAWTTLEEITLVGPRISTRHTVSQALLATPTYSLRSLSLHQVVFNPEELSWIIGATNGTLRELELTNVTMDPRTAEEQVVEVLSPHLANLERLKLVENGFGMDAGQLVRLSVYPCNANKILAACSHLLDFTLGFDIDRSPTTFLEPLLLPPTIRCLEIRGRWLPELVQLLGILESSDRPVELEQVVVVSPYRAESVRMDIACRSRGIDFEFRRW